MWLCEPSASGTALQRYSKRGYGRIQSNRSLFCVVCLKRLWRGWPRPKHSGCRMRALGGVVEHRYQGCCKLLSAPAEHTWIHITMPSGIVTITFCFSNSRSDLDGRIAAWGHRHLRCTESQQASKTLRQHNTCTADIESSVNTMQPTTTYHMLT
jgi:hypothetical protein